jgi:hypothetical protein
MAGVVEEEDEQIRAGASAEEEVATQSSLASGLGVEGAEGCAGAGQGEAAWEEVGDGDGGLGEPKPLSPVPLAGGPTRTQAPSRAVRYSPAAGVEGKVAPVGTPVGAMWIGDTKAKRSELCGGVHNEDSVLQLRHTPFEKRLQRALNEEQVRRAEGCRGQEWRGGGGGGMAPRLEPM